MDCEDILKNFGHVSDKTGSPGFHGKYTSTTQSHKPSVRTDKYPRYKTGKEYYRYVPIVLGFAKTQDTGSHINDKSPYPSYLKIEKETMVKTGSDQVDHTITINPDYSVNLDNRLIASAPMTKSKAQKERFCKAVVWSLLNDPSSLEDKLKEIAGIISVPVSEKVPDEIPVPAPVVVDPFHGIKPFCVTCHYSVYEVPA